MEPPNPMPPPPDGDVNKGSAILAISLVGTLLASVTTALRMYVRAVVLKSVGSDDYCILVATLIAICITGFNVTAVVNGSGRHSYYLTNEQIVHVTKYKTLTQVFILVSTSLTKISLCLFLLRLVGPVQAYRVFLWTTVACTIAIGLATWLTFLFQCHPIERQWDRGLPGSCWPPAVNLTIALMQGSFAVLSDWLLALFPILVLRRLMMARKTKVALGFIMGLGVITGAAALVRTVGLSVLFDKSDATFRTVDLACYGLVEETIGIIAVNAPALRPLFTRVLKTGSQESDARKGYRHNDDGAELGKLSGKRKGPADASLETASEGRQPGIYDRLGSDASLVAKPKPSAAL